MSNYYIDMIREGEQYQDYVADQLRKSDPCIILMNYTSQKYQYEHGESATGIEIKLDKLFSKTGNIYIETAEKGSPNSPEYVPSGVMRDDNTWLYLVGDYNEAFLFSKVQLRKIVEYRKGYEARGIREVQTPTSIGILYPINDALRGLCLKHFKFDQAGNEK